MSDTTTTQSQSTFGTLFRDIFTSATTVLADVGKVRAQGYIQNLEAENFRRVQETLTRNAASPAGDKSDAQRAAAENTVNLFGFLTVPRENAPMYAIGFVLVALLSIALLVKVFRT